jgi:hypothetical protein
MTLKLAIFLVAALVAAAWLVREATHVGESLREKREHALRDAEAQIDLSEMPAPAGEELR